MVLAPIPSRATRLQVHPGMLRVGLLALLCGYPSLAALAAQSASTLKQPATLTLKQPIARAVLKPRLPIQFTTPTLVAAGFGQIPASFTTVPLVARGFGRLPATLITPVLSARGFGNLPAQFTTKPLIVALPAAR